MSETWFEVRVESDLALMLQRICNAYARKGRVARGDLLRRLESAIPAPASDGAFTVSSRDRACLTDALMVLMKQKESIPENDLSEMPELQRLLNRLMGHGPDEFPYQPPADRGGFSGAAERSRAGDREAGGGATAEGPATP